MVTHHHYYIFPPLIHPTTKPHHHHHNTPLNHFTNTTTTTTKPPPAPQHANRHHHNTPPNYTNTTTTTTTTTLHTNCDMQMFTAIEQSIHPSTTINLFAILYIFYEFRANYIYVKLYSTLICISLRHKMYLRLLLYLLLLRLSFLYNNCRSANPLSSSLPNSFLPPSVPSFFIN